MRFLWGSSDAGPSRQQDTAAAGAGDATPAAAATTASSSSSSSSSTPVPKDSAAAKTTSPAPEPAHLLSRFERTVADEEKYQEQQYQTLEEVPGCMRLFDEFLMCYALVPQLRNMYRHGELRDCTYKFDDFKYCMSMKGEDSEERRKLWIRRRAEWWASRRVGASSEDVWDARTEPLDNFPPLYPEDPTTANM